MAKINEQTLIITVSQLVRDADPVAALLDEEIIAQLEAVVSELAGNGTLVEIKTA